MSFDNYTLALIGVIIVGLVSIIGAFRKMKGGFGPFNLRVVGIILVATFVTVLGLANVSNLTAAFGILGAIAGYLFGFYRGGGNDQ